jgi:hypothetical protein
MVQNMETELILDEAPSVHVGRPPGVESATKLTLLPKETEKAIEATATAILSGRSVYKSRNMGPATEHDKRMINRVTGMVAEEFNRRVSDRLGALSDALIERVYEKLEADQIKPDQLFFGISVCEDKRAKLDGRGVGVGTTVNVQVNVNSERSREDVLTSLTEQK